MSGVPATMGAVLLRGHGDVDQYAFREDVPVPIPGPLDILVEVEAASLNNTDVNVRSEWYAGGVEEPGLRFPRIQGADVAGRIVRAGAGVDARRVGERVICDPHLRQGAERRPERSVTAGYLGFDLDGGFAQYVVLPVANAWPVPESLPAEELACYPVAYSTALEMLLRSRARAGQTIVVTGASGGVGTACVQLAKVLRLDVVAVASAAKAQRLRELGADHVVDRGSGSVVEAIEEAVGDVAAVLDVVGATMLPGLLEVVQDGGTCVTAGGIGGPLASIDLRQLIYKDVDLRGIATPRISTFAMLVDLIGREAIRAPVAGVHPLRELAAAQQEFMRKQHVGKIAVSVSAV